MTTIYVVTVGCYSNYRIIGAFGDVLAASKFKDKWGDAIKELELDKLEPYIDLSLYDIEMERDGTCLEISVTKNEGLPDRLACRVFSDTHTLWIQCYAKDEQHAIKIANEKRTQMIALGEWDGGDQ